jgi:hypothetical protein
MRDFASIDPARSYTHVDVCDKNGLRGKGDFIGSVRFLVETPLQRRLMELELRSGKVWTKSYVTLMCVQVAATTKEGAMSGVVNQNSEMWAWSPLSLLIVKSMAVRTRTRNGSMLLTL